MAPVAASEGAAVVAATDISWLLWLWALLLVVWDTLSQKGKARHLPKRIPLPQLPRFTCIVTGATSGIGLEVAREFAQSGAHVILAVRNPSNGKKLIQQWTEAQDKTGGPEIKAEVMELDLVKLTSVRTFAKDWEARKLPLHALINNAGVFAMNVKQTFSEDGFEQHLQVNHLGHALLSLLLLPSLLRGGPSRIVNVNSAMHQLGFVDPEDMNITKRKYSSVAAYSGSKLAQQLFSRMLQMRIPKEAGIDVILVHPGEVMTAVTRTLPKIIQEAEKISACVRFTPAQAARSVIFCATDKQVFAYARALREMGCPVSPYFSSNSNAAIAKSRIRIEALSKRRMEGGLVQTLGSPVEVEEEGVLVPVSDTAQVMLVEVGTCEG
ncbi:hypothetical protein R1flu_016230 [Riccia fluitans]|uniref:Retinol dehydrogenase 12 n=1 Tax=Riccia fluitans TaxID=41844 RepID=A0ABD1YM89_9MARC